MADEFAEKFKRELVDFHFDEIDKAVADRYQAAIATTQNIENVKKEVKARNRKTGETATKTIEIAIPLKDLNTKALGKIVVAGKLDPLIFATDVVTNSLWRHLQGLPPTAPLNELSSVKDWECPEITFVAAGNSMFDKI